LRAAPSKPIGAIAGSACRNGYENDDLADLPSIKIAHPGIGYIYRGQGVFDREVLLPRQTPPGESPRKHFPVTSLKVRWAGNTPTQMEMEGLPLFTELQFSIPANAGGKQLSDLRFRIAYQYVDTANVLSEEQYVNNNASEIYKPYQYQFELARKKVSTKNTDEKKVTYDLPAQTLSLPAEKIGMISRLRRAALPAASQPSTPLALASASPLEGTDVRLVRSCRSVQEIVDEMVENRTIILAEQVNRKRGGNEETVSSVDREAARLQIRTQIPLYVKEAEKALANAGCQKPALELIRAKN
jgi:hypothetical protein